MYTFTSDDLLLYVLNEAESDTRLAIEKAMLTDFEIKNEVYALEQTIHEMSEFELAPHPKSVIKIMEQLHGSKQVQIH